MRKSWLVLGTESETGWSQPRDFHSAASRYVSDISAVAMTRRWSHLRARRKVVEIERIALDVVSCGHVLQDDDLAVDSLETSGGWNELEPRVQEIGPALPLEDDLSLFTQNQKRISTSAASQGETLGNPKLDSRA